MGVVLGVVQVLAAVSVRTVVLFRELLAQLGAVVQVQVGLLPQLLQSVREGALWLARLPTMSRHWHSPVSSKFLQISVLYLFE